MTLKEFDILRDEMECLKADIKVFSDLKSAETIQVSSFGGALPKTTLDVKSKIVQDFLNSCIQSSLTQLHLIRDKINKLGFELK